MITKTHVGSFTAGQQGTYTIDVHNAGPSDDPGPFTVTDTLPSGMTLVSGSAPWTCSGPTSVSCQYAGALTSGADATALTLVVAVAPTVTATSLTNTASVASPLAPTNPTASDPTPIATEADLAVVKTHNGTFAAGMDETYSIGVRNNGPSDAAGPITVSDQLPAGETFVSGTGGSWNCSATSGQLVTCIVAGSLADQTAAASITLTVHVDSGVTSALVNTATVSSPTSDPDSSNNSSTDNSSSPALSADLRVSKVATTADFTAGSDGAYTLTVTNNGPADAAGPDHRHRHPARRRDVRLRDRYGLDLLGVRPGRDLHRCGNARVVPVPPGCHADRAPPGRRAGRLARQPGDRDQQRRRTSRD